MMSSMMCGLEWNRALLTRGTDVSMPDCETQEDIFNIDCDQISQNV